MDNLRGEKRTSGETIWMGHHRLVRHIVMDDNGAGDYTRNEGQRREKGGAAVHWLVASR